MAKPLNPVDFAQEFQRPGLLRWAQSVHKIFNGSIDMGVPTGKDVTGNFNTFSKGNTSGMLVRIGAVGSFGNSYVWGASSAAIIINHGLQRQPIGVHLVNSDKPLQIWQPQTPNENNIFIAPSDATANATVYVF